MTYPSDSGTCFVQVTLPGLEVGVPSRVGTSSAIGSKIKLGLGVLHMVPQKLLLQ